MSFTIEKNIPMPIGVKGNPKYPFKTMDIGDSFLLEDNSCHRASVYISAKCLDMKVSIKKEGNKLRVWRVK